MFVTGWHGKEEFATHYFEESRYTLVKYSERVPTLTLGPLAPAIPCCPGVPTAPCINQPVDYLLLPVSGLLTVNTITAVH